MKLSIEESEFFSSVKAGDISSVKLALRSEPYLVNFQDEIGKTPLHIAVEYGLVDLVKLFVLSGAKLDTTDTKGNSPLQLTVCLIEPFSKQRLNLFEIISTLLEFGGDINESDKGGFSPLHHAAAAGDTEFITFLVENGASVNQRNDQGLTPLHWGLCANIWIRDIQKHIEALETLIKHGANVNAKDIDGKSSLEIAFENNPGRPQLIQLLKKYGA